MQGLRKYILFSLTLVDALAMAEYLIHILGGRREASVLHDLLWHSINLLDAMKQEGLTSMFINSLLELGVTVVDRIGNSPIVSVPEAILAKIIALGPILVISGRVGTQIGATNFQIITRGFQDILGASKRALDVTLLSALDFYTSTLARLQHLGMVRVPVSLLYLLFIVYSQLKLACDFIRFIKWVIGAAFPRTPSEDLRPGYMDVGIETEDEDVFGDKEWDDSLVTPRSSQRNKKAMSLRGKAARKSLREVLSEL